MKKIKLTNGGYAIVDDSDFIFLNKWKWTRSPQGYAVRTGCIKGERVKQLMHRVIINPPENMQIDHINRDKIDNRKENLRIVTQSENMHNTGMWKNNTSGFKNICFDKSKNKWVVRKQINKKLIYMGRFNSIEEARLSLK